MCPNFFFSARLKFNLTAKRFSAYSKMWVRTVCFLQDTRAIHKLNIAFYRCYLYKKYLKTELSGFSTTYFWVIFNQISGKWYFIDFSVTVNVYIEFLYANSHYRTQNGFFLRKTNISPLWFYALYMRKLGGGFVHRYP